ncbi:MAG: hypothetical protein HQ503_19095 [Rhodospirillales bacterium]|nr:hypothetical protein [Rhodospirillales bacterium]
MTVLLSTSKNPPNPSQYDCWCAVGSVKAELNPAARVPGLVQLLISATNLIANEWLALGKKLAEAPGAGLAHAPACAANASDFGRMLAWAKVIETWAAGDERVAVLCDDPWMFRHLAGILDIQAGPPPPLFVQWIKLFWRGYIVRSKLSLELFWAAWQLREQRQTYRQGAVSLLVYGHPNTTIEGSDSYFGELMKHFVDLSRVFHVDCKLGRALELTGDGRNFSLHAWGNSLAALTLFSAKWRPGEADKTGPYGWLVRRAAALEGGTGQPAMIRWQQICQKAWLKAATPRAVVWPWENHSWEREFVRCARANGTATIGYQHTTIGKQELNYFPGSNVDGLESIPDQILTSGKEGRNVLAKSGIPGNRIAIGGAFRVRSEASLSHDPDGPIFLALPFDHEICAEMIEAVRPLGAGGKTFLIKGHPMTPYRFSESPGVYATSLPLDRQEPLAAVIYSSTTVGLEAVLGGLPTFEFLPSNKPPLDVLPSGIEVMKVTAETLEQSLSDIRLPPSINAEIIFSAPDMKIWEAALVQEVQP